MVWSDSPTAIPWPKLSISQEQIGSSSRIATYTKYRYLQQQFLQSYHNTDLNLALFPDYR
jgi:hypothetical protein